MKGISVRSVLQLAVLVLLFPLFFSYVPWIGSQPIAALERYPELMESSVPPEWAKYMTVGHGKVSYFRHSWREQPQRALLHGVTLLVCISFLAVSGRSSAIELGKEKNDV